MPGADARSYHLGLRADSERNRPYHVPAPRRRAYRSACLKVFAPVPSGISKRFCRYISQDVCPWNVRFARYLPHESPLAPRFGLAGGGARALARELLAMSHEEFAAHFKGSPMKRAKLRGLKRNAAVVLANVGSSDDHDALTRALADPEPLVREHAEWALERIRGESKRAPRPEQAPER